MIFLRTLRQGSLQAVVCTSPLATERPPAAFLIRILRRAVNHVPLLIGLSLLLVQVWLMHLRRRLPLALSGRLSEMLLDLLQLLHGHLPGGMLFKTGLHLIRGIR